MMSDQKLDDLIETRGILKGLNSTLGITSISLVIVFVLYAILLGKTASTQFLNIKTWIEQTLGWYYIALMLAAFLICLYFMFSKIGKIRLGQDHERPEFSNFAWFSMLFSCGTGAGMLFFSMSEPMIHFASQWSGGNPFMNAETKLAVSDFFTAKQAALDAGLMPGDAQFPMPNDLVSDAAAAGLTLTFFHWGTVAWGMYGFVGLSLAYFSFRKGLPLSIRSALYPLIGNRIYGPIGNAADILAVLGTIFGISTTLGLGTQQIGAGLVALGFIEQSSQTITVCSIVLVTALATLSATSGVGRGIKSLSTLNTYICLILLAYFLFASSGTNYIIANSLTTLGDFISNAMSMSLWTARSPLERTWQGSWTIFYWGWWIAWSAFVGLFIARISRGRTIREFILGVILTPSLAAMAWFSIIGSAGIYESIYGADISIYQAAVTNWDYAGSLYRSFDVLTPGVIAIIAKAFALVAVIIFFITAADSGTLVLGRLLAFGRRPPKQQLVIWGGVLGTVTLIVLLMGGTEAMQGLQAASIAGALPFSIVIIAMMAGLIKSLRKDSELLIVDKETVKKMIAKEMADSP
ncbi:BCCT family transporter [Marinomonas sp. TW1]|uniref:BCCT family transporter n=1 Tax=Marinomonas sp. TW1 TaxID=1561203 RepID=UPI0007AF1FCD|nr:BCCT family transporter [Marinomonas sp. TW1]KZN15271.1 transporter [Marinomonas sp. TW1]